MIAAPTRAASRNSRRSRLDDHPLGLRIEGIEAGIERRELDRYVDPRKRPAVVSVEARNLGPAIGQRRQIRDQRLVPPEHAYGLGLAHGRFADEVERERRPLSPQSLEHFAECLRVVRCDETARERGDVPADDRRHQPTRVQRMSEQRQATESMIDRGEVLLEMLADVTGAAQARQHIDEAKQSGADLLVVERLLDHSPQPVAGLENRRPTPRR